MKNKLFLLCATVLLLVLRGAATQAQAYRQVWADEFNGSISSNWTFETGGGVWGEKELQYYQPANATVDANNLIITARREDKGGYKYTSARMKTKNRQEFRYGKIEARIKLPQGLGLWPAFWMLGANIDAAGWPKCGEIDIMEHINSENVVHATEHWSRPGNPHVQNGSYTTTTPAEYHVYSVEWDANAIRTFVDGVHYHTTPIANNVDSTAAFHRPFYLLLNMAVGGVWPGPNVDDSKLPAQMYVDYVRVYQREGTAATPPVPPPAINALIQAETYNTMGGVELENTTDTGGGKNVKAIDTQDWMTFANINFPTSGPYTIEYRVASARGGKLSADLNSNSVALGELAVPATGGGQTWTTISQTVNINAGTYTLGIFAQAGGWNLNWLRITKQGSSAGIVSGGVYRLLARHSNKALDVAGNSSASQATVWQYGVNNGGAQRWVLALQGDGAYTLTHEGTNLCLDVQGNRSDNGALVWQYTANGGDAQRWLLEPTPDGYYKLRHKGTDKFLDVLGGEGRLADSDLVGQWETTPGRNQQWKLELLSNTAARTTTASVATTATMAATAADSEASSLSAFPNPSRGRTTLSFSAVQAQRVTVYAHNPQGNLVSMLTVPVQAGRTNFPLPGALAPGLYYVRATIDGQPQRFTLRVE